MTLLKKKKKPKHPCFTNDCNTRGVITQECELCLKKGESFLYHACVPHSGNARALMKRHILLKHPSTIPSVILAGLKGEDLSG